MAERRKTPDSHIALAMAARPARIGLLVETQVQGVHWLRMFESALAAQARFWGGHGNLLFPLTKDFTERELFWALADVFDADSFATYAPTWREMADIAPVVYDETVANWRADISERFSHDEAERFVAEANGEAALHPSVGDEQITLINRRLAPLSDPGPESRSLEWFDGSNPAHWPFTEISHFEELPPAISIPKSRGLGAARRLLLTALEGRAPATLLAGLAERGIESVEHTVSKYEIYGMVRGRNQPDLPGPWDLSMFGVSTFHTGRLLQLPVALVVGDSPWDFALFYALLRMTGRAWWLPSWLRRDRSYTMFLESSIQFGSYNDAREPVVVSTSSIQARDEVARTVSESSGGQLEIADWQDVLPDDPMRVLGSDTPGRSRVAPLVEGRVLELDTPVPTIARTKRPAEMRWISEARSAEWAPVRNRALARQLLAGDSDLVRTSRNGVAYFSTSSLILSGASLESVVVRPSLRPLPLADQVQALLHRKGWSCAASDKAIYALEAMKLFGGFDALCDAILSPDIRTILDAYRAKDGPGPRLSSDGRKYLTYGHFEGLLEVDDAAPVIEPLIDQGVLARGVVLKCARCRQAAWHSAALTPKSFHCDRCGLDQDANRAAWFDTAEPVLSYRLAEVVFQLLEHNGALPLLAAKAAFGESDSPVGRGYELTVAPPGEKAQEVDIFQSDGYRLWIGEASVKPQLSSKRLDFISRLAEVVDAYGVLLATSKDNWNITTAERAKDQFPGAWPRLWLFGGVQMHPSDKLGSTDDLSPDQ